MPLSEKQALAAHGKGVFGKVANYAALPDPTLHDAETWIALAAQGTAWLPGSLGGTYYPKGQYYSDGTQWIYDSNSYQASQSDTNTGTIADQWVSPLTLANSVWAFTVAKVLATALTGLNVSLTGTITSSDTILTGFGRLQNQITTISTALSNYVTLTGTETLTNKRITERVSSITSSATPTPNADTTDLYKLTAQAAAAAFVTPTGTPTDGQTLLIDVSDNGTARALSFDSGYKFSTDQPAPTTTVIGKKTKLGFEYDIDITKWCCLGWINI